MAGVRAMLDSIIIFQVVLLLVGAAATPLSEIQISQGAPISASFSDVEILLDTEFRSTDSPVTESVPTTTDGTEVTETVIEAVTVTEITSDERSLRALDTLLIQAERLSVSETNHVPTSRNAIQTVQPANVSKAENTSLVVVKTVETATTPLVRSSEKPLVLGNSTVHRTNTIPTSTKSPGLQNPTEQTVTLLYGKAFIEGVGRGDSYTPYELRQIAKLKFRVQKDLTQPHMQWNKFMIRFLRARRMNVDAAEDMIRKALAWRKVERMDTILSEDFSWWERNFPFFFPLDRDGRPGVASGIGGFNLRKYILAGRAPQVVRYVYYALEKAVHNGIVQANLTGIEYNYGHLIFDLAGYDARNHACVACIPYLLQMLQNYEAFYPQVGKRIIGINAPRLFENALNMARPFISAVTQSAIRLFGYNKAEWRPELLKIFPPENLTPEFGGTLKIKLSTGKPKHHS